MKLDRIYIQGLEMNACIGVFDWERKITQKLVLGVELDYDSRPAALTDDITKAVDYGLVSERVIAHVEHSSFELIETLAHSLAELILSEFPVHRVLIDLQKPGAVSRAQTTGIKIERFKV